MSVITGDQIPRFVVVALKGHCKMMAAGMSHSKISKTEMLRKAGEVTGKKYKRGQHEQAAIDLDQWLKDNPA